MRSHQEMLDKETNLIQQLRKCTRIFVLGHYLFLVAHSSLLGTDNVRRQISEHIFAPNGDCCLYLPWWLSQWKLSNCIIQWFSFYSSRIFPSFSWGIFGHVTRLDQSRASEKIWWIIIVFNLKCMKPCSRRCLILLNRRSFKYMKEC